MKLISDKRGTLYEAFKLPNDGQIFFVVIKPGQTRGNHYHREKTERFLVVYGNAVIQTRHISHIAPRYYEVSGVDPEVVTIEPYFVHNISTEEGCILCVWVDQEYNDKQPDTVAEEV